MVIARVPSQYFSALAHIAQEDPENRTLRSILNELIDGVNAGASPGLNHLTASFTPASFPGPVPLGVCPAGRIAFACAVEILTPFDGGVLLTVGDPIAEGRLMPPSGADAGNADLYVSEPHHRYALDQALYLYLPAGMPSVGEGQVTVYLS